MKMEVLSLLPRGIQVKFYYPLQFLSCYYILYNIF